MKKWMTIVCTLLLVAIVPHSSAEDNLCEELPPPADGEPCERLTITFTRDGTGTYRVAERETAADSRAVQLVRLEFATGETATVPTTYNSNTQDGCEEFTREDGIGLLVDNCTPIGDPVFLQAVTSTTECLVDTRVYTRGELYIGLDVNADGIDDFSTTQPTAFGGGQASEFCG